MATLGDLIKRFYINYIAPSEEEIKKVPNIFALMPDGSDATMMRKEQFGTDELSLDKMRKVVKQTPLLSKGIRKKSLDSVRGWFDVVTLEDKPIPVYDLNIIRDFEERSRLKQKWVEMAYSAHVYGDGYLLLLYAGDKNSLDAPPSKHSKLYSVEIIDSENIKEVGYHPKHGKKDKILYFHYEDFRNNKDYWIHPDRILHLPHNKLPHSIFGNSDVNLLRNIIKSKINVDIATGEILAWFAHGVYDIVQEGLTPNEKEKWKETAKAHPAYWIHDETAQIQSINPQAINPKAFYDYLIMNIAAALIMPTHVLMGIQVGRVTGAEVGFADYYKDIKDIQDLDYTPLLEWLYSKLLNSYGRRWKYKVNWKPVFIGEMAEAEILQNRVKSAVEAYQAGIISLEEARRIMNEGQIILDNKKEEKDANS